MTIGLEVLVTLYGRLRRQLLLDWTIATEKRPFASQRRTLVPAPRSRLSAKRKVAIQRLGQGPSLRRGHILFNRLLGNCWNRGTRNEPVAGHDCQQLLAVWRPAGIHNALYIQKVLRTQVRGKDD